MSIPAKRFVNVIPGVLVPAGNALALNSVFNTQSTRVPVGVVMGFAGLTDVKNFFGPSSIEAILAGIYFSGFTNCDTLPGVLYFAQYNVGAVGAYLRSGSFAGVTLAQLQELSGGLIVVIDGRTVTSANIDLSTATSYSNAAALIQTGIQTPGGIFTGNGTIDDGAGGAGNILTVTVATAGQLHIGDVVTGPGIAGNTTITAFGTGTGGVGTYTVGGAPQTVTPAVAIKVTSAATVTYDAQLQRFLIHSATTGIDSSVAYATGTLSAGLKFTAATGAVLSPGAAAADPIEFMDSVAAGSQNWATFMTCWEPDVDTMLQFAQWVQTTNERFGYVGWTSDITILQGAAPASFPAQVAAAEMVGVLPIYETDDDNGNGRIAAFACGTTGSIDYDQTNGRITYAYKGQAGLVPSVSNETEYTNLLLNSCNAYVDVATSNDQFRFFQPGSTPGPWVWFDPYVNQIWLNANLQLALLTLLTQVKSLPYNSEGYNLIRAAANDPIQRALNAGVIRPGITLSNSQRAQINSAAGANVADTVQNSGYYLQILDAPPEVRIARGSPPMKFWYTDGGSIQTIELNSIDVQ